MSSFSLNLSLVGSAAPRAKRILPIVNPATGLLCNSPTVTLSSSSTTSSGFGDRVSCESADSMMTGNESPISEVAAASPSPPLKVPTVLEELKFFWKEGHYDPRMGGGVKCYNRAMMDTIRRNPTVKELKPQYTEECKEALGANVLYAQKNPRRANTPSESHKGRRFMFVMPNAAPKSEVEGLAPISDDEPDTSFQSRGHMTAENPTSSYPRWSTAGWSQVNSNNSTSPDVEEASVREPAVCSRVPTARSLEAARTPTDSRRRPISVLPPSDQSDTSVTGSPSPSPGSRTICQTTVAELVRAVQLSFPSMCADSTVLEELFTPVVIEGMAFAHRLALSAGKKKLEMVQEKHNQLAHDNYEQAKRLAELQNVVNSQGEMQNSGTAGSFLDGSSPTVYRRQGDEEAPRSAADLISFDTNSCLTPPLEPVHIDRLPQTSPNPVAHKVAITATDSTAEAARKLTMFLNRIREELSGEEFYSYVDEAELKQALKALRSEAKTLKDFPFANVVRYVRKYLANKYTYGPPM